LGFALPLSLKSFFESPYFKTLRKPNLYTAFSTEPLYTFVSVPLLTFKQLLSILVDYSSNILNEVLS